MNNVRAGQIGKFKQDRLPIQFPRLIIRPAQFGDDRMTPGTTGVWLWNDCQSQVTQVADGEPDNTIGLGPGRIEVGQDFRRLGNGCPENGKARRVILGRPEGVALHRNRQGGVEESRMNAPIDELGVVNRLRFVLGLPRLGAQGTGLHSLGSVQCLAGCPGSTIMTSAENGWTISTSV